MTLFTPSDERQRMLLQQLQRRAFLTDESLAGIGDAISAGPRWIVRRMTHADFYDNTHSVMTKDVSAVAATFAGGCILHAYILKHQQEFIGGSVTSCTVTIAQPSGSTALGSFASAFSVFDPPSNDPTAPGLVYAKPECILNWDEPTQLMATMTTGTVWTDSLTQGILDLYVLVSRLPLAQAQAFTVGNAGGLDGAMPMGSVPLRGR